MEFGKTDISEINGIDFSLPAEPPVNKTVLGGKPSPSSKVFVGCARWGTKEWLGHFYPENLKEKDFLHYYEKLFNCIELNITYYRIPSFLQVEHWRSQVHPGFRFCPKFPQLITHVKKLQHCDKEVSEFVQSISGFGETLGPVFLMPYPQMDTSYFPLIKRFIERLPSSLNVFLELRHPSWFTDGLYQPLYDFVADYKIGLVITDASGRRDCAHMHLSKKETFIRFVGNGLHPTDYARVQNWTNRIGLWLGEGIENVYFFMHQHDELNAALLNRYVVEQFNTLPNIHLESPQIIRPQATLFD